MKDVNKLAFTCLILYSLLMMPVFIIVAYELRAKPQPVIEVPPIQLPNFSSISDVQQKKQAFFTFFLPLVEQANQQILTQRAVLLSGSSKHETLTRLCLRYSKNCDDVDALKRLQLLLRVDVIPPSLVLAQAAMESGWGTSRFAQRGFNFFGQWCYQKGCGLVPKHRGEEAVHEVRVFASPLESVQAYLFNLNTHGRYQALRQQRFKLRWQQRDVLGTDLVSFLLAYSQRGQHYVDELTQVMKYNHLIIQYDVPFWLRVYQKPGRDFDDKL